MGANGSIDALCSTEKPAGLGDSEFMGVSAVERRKMYELPLQNEDHFSSLPPMCCSDTASVMACRKEGELSVKPMQVAPREDLSNDRINPWTRDLVATGEAGCGQQMVSFASCGAISTSKTKAPKDYMADMPEGGSIVLNSKGQCILKAESRIHSGVENFRIGSHILDAKARELAGEEEDILEAEGALASWSANTGISFPKDPKVVSASKIQPLAPVEQTSGYDRV
mmetsp:Transcript_85914/g.135641  ORF Transcript_85914/g.135641 Transcript_85914/m.135641 type:complete len:226 (+) Transcript_85914:60-737(+)